MARPFTLRVYRGDELLRAETFTRDLVKIGRLASAHLSLDDERLARIHAVLEVGPDGRISVIDMSTPAGTTVNGQRVVGRGFLRPGDVIGVGGLRIVLEGEGVGATATATTTAVSTATGPSPLTHGEARVHDSLSPRPGPGRGDSGDRAATAAPTSSAPATPTGRTSPLPRTGGEDQGDGAKPSAAAATGQASPLPRGGGEGQGDGARPPSATSTAAPTSPPTTTTPTEVPRQRPTTSTRIPSEAIADAVAGTERGVEIRLLWGDALLDAATFVKPARPVTLGEEPGCTFLVPAADLPARPFPVLRFEDGSYRFLFGRGMTGGVERGGQVLPFSQLVRDRQAAPDDRVQGAWTVAVPAGGAVRAEVGSGLRLEARLRRPPPQAVAPWWERLDYRWLNLLLLLLFLQSAFVVTAVNWPQDVDTVADDLFKNPSRMAKFVIKAPEPQARQNPALDKLARELGKEPGEMAEKHKGEEGKMGKKDAPQTNARSAPRAIDPSAKDVVKNTGLLAVLGRGRGASGGLSTIFGQGGLGGDLKGAIGNMFGPVVGDSAGAGGLGLKGTGRGGGGAGETIGIGAVGTKGRGGGLGGYGSGVGGLGRKTDRDVAIDTQNVRIVGAIDPELIRKVIREHASQVRYCYEQQLALNPKLEGKVAIRWQIGPDGRASSTMVDAGATTIQNEEVQRCIMARIVTWEFPKPRGGGIAIVTYPWVLRTAGG
jgi:hypothetical protein